MWWDRSEPLEIYLSQVAVGRGATPASAAQWVETSGLDDSLRHVAAWLEPAVAARTRRVRVWLSAALARPFIVPGTAGARTKHEAHALATAMAPDATGIDGEGRLWLDRWRLGEPTLGVAMPVDIWRELHDIVEARNAARTARSSAIGIASVRPWWNLAFDAVLAESRGEAVRVGWSLCDGAGILHGVVERGSVVEIGFDRQGPHDPAGDLLRRRLQVNWGVNTAVRHLQFERAAAGDGTRLLPIGAWRSLPGSTA